jgi:hypothetical protein
MVASRTGHPWMEKGKREVKRDMGEATSLDGEGEEGDAAR